MIKLGILGSTNGTDLQAILDSIKNKTINASVSIVISNQENAFILKRAREHGVNTCFISHKNKTREEFDRKVTNLLEELSQGFCHHWQDKILNVHPSLLPKYAGGMDTNVHKEVLLNRDTKTGCTIHFVTEDVDSGPILIQKSCAVEKNDTVETLKKKVQALEGPAFVEAINLITNKLYAR